MPLAHGTRLGRYVIASPLGAGGMGEVYRAEDSLLNRQVAVKVLPERLAENPDALRRFEKEAKALAALSHSNILAIHDFISDKGLSFVVMELLEGETLRSRMEKSLLPWQKTVEISTDIAEGLAAAHSKGVIHRDLKPENILLTSQGGLKILDFGLARLKPVVTEAELTEVPTISRATESGIVMGTVPYMSPEQVRGQAADARSDIFSFGCILYEMLSGKRPFSGSNAAETTAAILRDDPHKLTGIPSELERIVQHCLEKDPERRLHSAHDLAFALKDLPAHSSNTIEAIRPSALRHRKAWIVAAVVVLAALVVALGAIEIRKRFSGPAVADKIESLAVLPLKNLSGDPKQEYFADGMTEELIAKLARISALRVISRTSVMEYKEAYKPLPEIAKELKVDAIVEGSVLQSGDRVRITAQLIHAPTDRHLWAESYERDMRDILALQNEVASAIAREIKVKVSPKEKAYLERAPKVRPDAYQAYLRGIQALNFLGGAPELRQAVPLFERAVNLDPNFALAYVYLSTAHSFLYFSHRTKTHLELAKKAADRAFELEPDLPEGHMALGSYYYFGYNDYSRALQEFQIAQRNLPAEKNIFMGIGNIRRRQGHFEEAINQHKKAFEIAPREASVAMQIGNTLLKIRRYSEAEHYYDVSISLEPQQTNSYLLKFITCLLKDGSTRRARDVIDQIPDQNHPEVIYFWAWLNLYERKYDSALDSLRLLSSEYYSDQWIFIPWDQLRALVYYMKNEPQHARSSFDSARIFLEKEIKMRPNDHRVHSALGVVYAGLGRKQDAIREGRLAVDVYPISKDAMAGPFFVEYLAHIYTMVGEYDAAIEQLDFLLSIPFQISVPLICIDPRWDPLRSHPRFQKILEKYGKPQTR